MRSSRKTKILNCICVVLVLLACVVRLLGYHYGTFSYNSIICVLFLYRFGINLDSPTAKTACTTRCTKKSDRVRSYDNSLDIIKNNKI